MRTRSKARLVRVVSLACIGLAGSAGATILTNTSGVYDEQTTQLNAVDATATTPTTGNVSLLSLTAMKADVATAFAAGNGGVINFDDVSTASSGNTQIQANYGAGFAKTLTLSGTGYQVDMSAAGTIGATPISGSVYLRNGDSTGVQSFAFSSPLTEVGATVLARGVSRTVTATVTYDDLTTATIGPVSIAAAGTTGSTSSPDTYFGFEAPTGRTITALSLSAGANNYFVVDDIGFVLAPAPAPEPGVVGVLGVAGAMGLARRRRSR